MQLEKDKYCKHLPHLSKQTLRKLTQSTIKEYCQLHDNHPMYYLCLHCGHACCLDYVQDVTCLKFHFIANTNHYFALEMEQGTIWCSACNDSIQNKIFTSTDKKDEQVMKMERFVGFIADIWKQLLAKVDLNKTVVSHRGLKNLGNTCFLNVVLQCLYASVPLKKLYESYQIVENKLRYNKRCVDKQIEYFYDDVIEKHEQEKWNVVSSKKPKDTAQSHHFYKREIKNADFNILIRQLMQEMDQEAQFSYSPSEILDYLGFINKKYHLNEEQDAEQLLLLIIDLLSEGQKISLLKDIQRYRQVEKILGFQKLTPVQSIYGFYLLNQIQCSKCKEITHSINLSYNIAISLERHSHQQNQIVHKSDKIEIDFWEELTYPKNEGSCPLLDTYFHIERLNLSNNYYSCSKCKSIVAYRKHYLISQPQVLIVSVKRFNSKLQKNTGRVPIEKQINLKHFCASEGETQYDLIGMIVHEGKTLSTGHYICFIKLEQCWLLCSDHRVQAVNWKYVESQEAYILLYQRKDFKKV